MQSSGTSHARDSTFCTTYIQAVPVIQDVPAIQAVPVFHAEPVLQAVPTIKAEPVTQAVPAIQAITVLQAVPAGQGPARHRARRPAWPDAGTHL